MILSAREKFPMPASWLSFGTAYRRVTKRFLCRAGIFPCAPFPAMLSKALSRPCLVYPLASLDVSGQWPVSRADASPNEVCLCHIEWVVKGRFCYPPKSPACHAICLTF